MAVLGSNFLNGCNSIPSFIGSGYRMVFNQTSAPVSWTKETATTHNNVALRVIGGTDGTTLSPGGTAPFTTILTENKSFQVPLDLQPSGLTINNSSGFISIGQQPNASAITINAHALTIGQTRSHRHDYSRRAAGANYIQGSQTQSVANPQNFQIITTASTGGGQGHSHVVNGAHDHTINTPGSHNHTFTDNGHNHTFEGNSRNFGVLYMDVIICSKD